MNWKEIVTKDVQYCIKNMDELLSQDEFVIELEKWKDAIDRHENYEPPYGMSKLPLAEFLLRLAQNIIQQELS